MTGYLHPEYAQALAEYGAPRELPRCGGWILDRQIPGFNYRDAMGCYPLFCCRDWSRLYTDLEDVRSELVSLSMVTDPFGLYDVAYLQHCFGDIVFPFKEHFVVDLSLDWSSFVSSHHRRNARKALRDAHVEVCRNPIDSIGEWMDLYSTLARRHGIRGIPAFSRPSFLRQFRVPGEVVFRAVHQEMTIGMMVWYIQGDVGYYHLGAYSDIGYEVGASFALFWHTIGYFSDMGLRWLNLGAGAGVTGSVSDGLARFKRGWSTGTRTAYFCGRIFDQGKYKEITEAKRIQPTDYFPAYRKGEFG